MFTKAFWIAAIERAAKTVAQTAAAIWSGSTLTNIVEIDFQALLGLSASAGVLSLLTSLASIPLSSGVSPSLVPNAEVVAANE